MPKSLFPFLMLLLALAPTKLYADIICGRVIAPSGLRVRSAPSLESTTLHILATGDSFAYYADSHKGLFQTIQDEAQSIRGEWIAIILHPKFDGTLEDEAQGYIFYCDAYVEDIECNRFRHRLYAKDLYTGADTTDILRQQRLSQLLEISFFPRGHSSSIEEKQVPQFIKTPDHYQIDADTIFLSLANQQRKRIISYPFGKNGNEDYLEFYQYQGYAPAFGQYLISGSYWDNGDYFLIDQKTGQESPSFLAYPSISPQGNYLLSISSEAEDDVGSYLELFTIENGKIKAIFEFAFKNWIYEGRCLWLDERNCLIKVSSMQALFPIQAYAEEEKNVVPPTADKRYHYLKLRIR